MIDRTILTTLFNKIIIGFAIYGIGMSLAYAGYVGQDYDWCDPRYCCPPKE